MAGNLLPPYTCLVDNALTPPTSCLTLC